MKNLNESIKFEERVAKVQAELDEARKIALKFHEKVDEECREAVKDLRNQIRSLSNKISTIENDICDKYMKEINANSKRIEELDIALGEAMHGCKHKLDNGESAIQLTSGFPFEHPWTECEICHKVWENKEEY